MKSNLRPGSRSHNLFVQWMFQYGPPSGTTRYFTMLEMFQMPGDALRTLSQTMEMPGAADAWLVYKYKHDRGLP